MASSSTHESFERNEKLKPGSNRVFGFVFVTLFLLISLGPLIQSHPIRWWSLVVASTLLAITLFVPKLLFPLNFVWFQFGLLLHRIVSPIILTLLFFLALTPVALFARVVGKRFFPLKKDESEKTYWISREKNPMGSMLDQF